MSTSRNVDYLSGLPSELLQDIFDRAQLSGKSDAKPLSKTLVPFQQKSLFETVNLDTYERFDEFCRTAKENPALMKYVRVFGVRVLPTVTTMDEVHIVEKEDLLLTEEEDVRTLFKSLEQVTSVTLNGSFTLASAILSHEVATCSLKHLSSLSLTSTFSGFDDPFHPSHYQHLEHLPALRELNLQVYDRGRDDTVGGESLPQANLSLPTIRELALVGPLTLYETSVKSLLSSLDSLTMITLEDDSPTSHLYELAAALSKPQSLRILTLHRYTFHGPAPQGSILNVLSAFPRIVSLIVGGSCAPLSPTFYDFLRSLPLKIITFEATADVNLDELTKLITGPLKHKSLKSIYFENVEGKAGLTIEEMGGVPQRAEDGEGWILHPGWEEPVWPENFNREDLIIFEDLARREGIKVGGSAIDALEVEDLLDAELEKLSRWESD